MEMPSQKISLAVAALCLIAAGCSTDDGRTMQIPPGGIQTPVLGTIASSSTDESNQSWSLTTPWSESASLDTRYSCDDLAVSPPMVWSEAPEMTRAYGVTLTKLDDPDTILWALADIDFGTRNLVEGIAPDGATVGVNSFGAIGYEAPCPDVGATDQYVLSVFAQEFPTDLGLNPPARDIVNALNNGALAILTSQFSYQRR